MGGSILGQEEQGKLDSLVMSTIDFADIITLLADIHLPQLVNLLRDIEQVQDPTATKSKVSTVIWRDPAQAVLRFISGTSEQLMKKDHKASELLDGAPQAHIQRWNLVEGEESVGSAGARDIATDNMAEDVGGKTQKGAPMLNTVRGQEHDMTKWKRENNSKKIEELKQSRSRVKAEEKPTIPKTKRKRNPPELSHNSFKKPQTHLGMHMLESVQVFHPLGKKSEKKTSTCSSHTLGASRSNKDPRPGPHTTVLLDVTLEGQGQTKTLGKAQRTESSADMECPVFSQYELSLLGRSS